MQHGLFCVFRHLKEKIRSSVEDLSLELNYSFQHDNDPKNPLYIAKEWFLYNAPKQLHTPSQSTDLNR